MTLQEIFQELKFKFGANKAKRINYADKEIPEGDSILIEAREESAAFQLLCKEFEVEYAKLQAPSSDEQHLFAEVLRMKKEHGI